MPQLETHFSGFYAELAIFCRTSQKTTQTHFCFQPSIPFPRWSFLQLQQYWHLYCFAILGSTFTVIHSVKQRPLRNRPGLKCAATSEVAWTITKRIHSSKPASRTGRAADLLGFFSLGTQTRLKQIFFVYSNTSRSKFERCNPNREKGQTI